ncbi:hypothetical protein M9M90_02390 [Phenylobacterium sp. LH3H17]|uniref:hypothetical protein n=1 Tax=Phenylobacterium sp. LH3H17 TaxID=2903901 RepID=UPI0020C9C076|nr:hypothetical protein [Phenylobacterium sp. LH3H17]UTP40042.1 hypothetical protein M9M90_02390 [Phenylobacterium sp. LH3H17]
MSDVAIHLLFWALFLVLMLSACGFALWKGGPAERLGAALILGFALLWEFGRLLPPSFSSFMPIAQLIGDGLTAVGLLAIAVRYASLWLGGALMFQAAQFSLHSFYLVTDREVDSLHRLINNINLYAILICLTAGAIVSWRARVKAASKAAAAA